MAKGGYEKGAVIGNLDDPLALETFSNTLEATGASSFASVLDASLLHVGMVEVVRWQQGYEREVVLSISSAELFTVEFCLFNA